MGLIKEPKNVDFSIQSEPWTEKDLFDFRVIMNEIKSKNQKIKSLNLRKPKKVLNVNS